MTASAGLERAPAHPAAPATDGRPECVVLGAGVAGLVAALDLARAGCRVTVVEAAPFPGGRTSSWRTSSGLHADTGFHVVASHYRTLFDVLRSIDAAGDLVWWDRHLFRRTGSPDLWFRLTQAPAPFHLLHPACAMSRVVGAPWRLLRAAWEAARATEDDLCRLDELSYLDWHTQHGLDRGFLLQLAEYAADATTFLPPERVSARAALSWMKYMFHSARSARVGSWRRPLAEALVGPLVRAIERHGGIVRTSTAVVRLEHGAGGIRHAVVRRSRAAGPWCRAHGQPDVTGSEETLRSDAMISALPVQALRAVLDPALVRLTGLERALTLDTVPALSVVLGFDRYIAPGWDGALLVGGSVIRNVVDLGALWGRPSGPTCLQVLVGRATEHFARTDEEIVGLLLHDLRELHPATAAARLVDAHVARIEAAMFAATPGAHARRPVCRTGVENFFVAGDWTRHAFNASIEGAACSGRAAAQAVLRRVAPPPAGAER
ncbi:MAG: hydroxysqualene dehydroxylase [Vicinamibacterales bacterium]